MSLRLAGQQRPRFHGEAGAILQKFRTYGIRVAVVRSPAMRLSRRFSEVIADESRGPYFRLFGEQDSAQKRLCLA